MPPIDPTQALAKIQEFVLMGGPAMIAIAALSILALTTILWKLWRLSWLGAWSGGRHTARALDLWAAGRRPEARAALSGRHHLRPRLVAAAMAAAETPGLTEAGAREETLRVARGLLLEARAGLRLIELCATIGPLLGLFGTVTGMIAAFQALQEAGAQADPATLAGGIWEALLTTAAGMAVAIPAQIALTGFESVLDRLRHDMEDAATRVFVIRPGAQNSPAAPAPTPGAILRVAE
ncbi:MotA/TolQ/ExbB proton channel family protein [Phaeovulum vinaykumarii]|uniref:Outer membrane transport energization protein ExbB n=1 Tax=Phaeovulum vinaykumarii TaxID=407234 RepID=A0A1N7JLG9_9RHOB|nr:MotA/TolQ/ExbB proton channel family protein [Phaeovulum vinaykumarii]SIS50150.1 outer membrane transport energization protein ExbB [Phaeovulum vinaykumarii]SOB90122.1 outer membrane transport energization protein ExbB [Phaeovulum vinaykumarii]